MSTGSILLVDDEITNLHGLVIRLRSEGFEVTEARGAILFCGPFSDLAFSGLPRVMAANKRLGRRLPRAASDFYIAAVKR